MQMISLFHIFIVIQSFFVVVEMQSVVLGKVSQEQEVELRPVQTIPPAAPFSLN